MKIDLNVEEIEALCGVCDDITFSRVPPDDDPMITAWRKLQLAWRSSEDPFYPNGVINAIMRENHGH